MRQRLSQLADLPGLAALVALLWLLLQTVGPRLRYPFDLEWMEGGMLVHALRVSQGQPLYTLPSADWIPYIYPPLYPWVMGAVGLLTGVDYDLGRAISVLGVLAACVALVAALRREGGSTLLGLGVAALFLSTYDDSGTFFDLVRADGLLIGLLAWSLVSVRSGRVVLGGLLLVLAWLTKHNAAAFGLPMVLWLWWALGSKQALRFVLASVLPALVVLAALQVHSEGLFLVYLLEVPSHHPFVAQRFIPGAPKELVGAFPAALVLVLLGLVAGRVAAARRPAGLAGADDWRQGVVFWTANIGLATLLCMVMRAHHGGYLNVLVPGHWALALAGGLGAVALRRAWDHPVMVLVTALVVGGQAWQARWELAPTQPTEADLAAGEALLERIAQVDGDVFMPHAPWYPVKVGKAPSLALIALWDIDHDGKLSPYAEDLDRALARHRWGALILADRKLKHGFLDHYQAAETIRYSGRALYPKTGWSVRPRYVYLPTASPTAQP